MTTIKTTLKQLQAMVDAGAAVDVTNSADSELPERFRIIAASSAAYGISGVMVQEIGGRNRLILCKRSSNLFHFI